MRYFRPRPGLTAWLFVLLVAAPLAFGAALAQAATKYVVIQPIDVCNTSGPSGTTGCAPFNTQSVSPDPSKATTTTPIGFVDGPTNVNLTRATWLQTGIDVTFLPIAEYNNTTYQDINDVACKDSTCTTLTSPLFDQLTSGSNLLSNLGCKSNCKDPLASSKINAINMFFVNTISGTSTGSLFGFAWLNGNGIAIAKDVFFPSPPRFDTLAHEIGHNLNLDHFNFGAGTTCSGTPSPQGCNVMDAGAIGNAPFRVVPGSSGCSSTTSPFGFLFDLGTGLCGTNVPLVPQADQLILGTSTNTTQQGQALLSGLMNPIPNVNATAGGGDVSFTVDFPNKPKQTVGRPGEYIFALILALPEGFMFGTNPFTLTATNGPQVFGKPFILNGNNGKGNTNCLKPLTGAPSIECLEIDLVPDTFTANTFISFTSDIIFKNTTTTTFATAKDLACTPPEPLGCLDITFAFSDLLATSSAFVIDVKTGNTTTANSQLPDEGVPSTIILPANSCVANFPCVTDFPSVANLNPPLTLTGFTQTPCTLTGTSTMCPAPHGGNWANQGE